MAPVAERSSASRGRTRFRHRLDRRGRLRAADLFRFLRLFGHGGRARADVRFPLSRELQPALAAARSPNSGGAGTFRCRVVPRLPLHPARRKPRGRWRPTESHAVRCSSALWHGASWNFLIWGPVPWTIPGRWNASRRSAQRWRRCRGHRAYRLVLPVVLFGWVFFRAPTLERGAWPVGRMFAFESVS